MENYDIIIAGGGPAGLTALDDLCKDFKVLLIEKQKPGKTSCTWYSYKDRAIKNKLEQAVLVETPHIKFSAPSVEHYMKDDCVIFDHNKVMNTWIDRATKNGGYIKQEEFISYRTEENQIVVTSNKGVYSAKLLIDAMGINSPIVKQKKLIKRHDAWVIYGSRIKIAKPKEKVSLEYYPLNDAENTYVGVHPLSDTDINFYVFKGVKNSLGNPNELIKKYEEVLKETYPDAEILEELKGSIVSGELKKYAFDRLIFFGSSGMLNPDGCGMGFNEILLQHNTFSDGIKKAMLENNLNEKTLQKVAKSLKDQETLAFQKIIGAFSLYFIKSPGKWDGGVKWLNAMGTESKYWMRNEMKMDWLMNANIKLNGVIPLSETFKLVPFDDFFFIIKNLLRFSIRAIKYKIKN